MTATIWRSCPSCGASFEQPDDPGRKRIFCSRACQRTSAGQRTGRQDRRSQSHVSAASAPALIGPAPASATGSARTSKTSVASSVGRRRTAATASGPAQEAAMIWLVSAGS